MAKARSADVCSVGGTRSRGSSRAATLTVAGTAPEVVRGSSYVFEGQWANHRKYGRQVSLRATRWVPPNDPKEIETFLSSSVKHVGKKRARLIVEAFGEETLLVLDRPDAEERLAAIVGKGAAKKIFEAWCTGRSEREAHAFLTMNGLPNALAHRVVRAHGERTIDRVERAPFRATEGVWGMTWQMQVALADALDKPPHCDDRYGAALRKVLNAALGYGHMCLQQSRLLRRAGELVERHTAGGHDAELMEETLEKRSQQSRQEGSSGDRGRVEVRELAGASEPWCYLPSAWDAEDGLADIFAQRAGRMAQQRLKDDNSAARKVYKKRAEKWLANAKGSFANLSEQQKGVVMQAATSDLLVINGGPGSGKTFVLAAIYEFMRTLNRSVALCAPTGRAARRMAESARSKASTIHRLLGFKPAGGDDEGGEEGALEGGFEFTADNPLPHDVLIVDEASMLDASLAHALLSAIKPGSALILVGDVDQLPPVGAGQPFADVVALSGKRQDLQLPVSNLAENFRQSAGSTIPALASAVNSGNFELVQGGMNTVESSALGQQPQRASSDVLWVKAAAEHEGGAPLTTREVVRFYLRKSLGFSPQDIMVLSPMKIRQAGTVALNDELRGELNDEGGNGIGYRRFQHTYCVGDRVIQLSNDPERNVFNGDIGYVTNIDDSAKEVTVRFEDSGCDEVERVHVYSDGGKRAGEDEAKPAKLEDLQPAWAMTIHKSQGSEFPCVLLVLLGDHRNMHVRKLLYTAITRAKEKLVIVYDTEHTIKESLKKSRGNEERISKLGELMEAKVD